MFVVVAPKHSTALFLRAYLAVLHPLVIHDLFKCSTPLGIDLKHPADDVSALPRQETQETPRPFDYLRLLLALAAGSCR